MHAVIGWHWHFSLMLWLCVCAYLKASLVTRTRLSGERQKYFWSTSVDEIVFAMRVALWMALLCAHGIFLFVDQKLWGAHPDWMKLAFTVGDTFMSAFFLGILCWVMYRQTRNGLELVWEIT
jgi:hypothetical protein